MSKQMIAIKPSTGEFAEDKDRARELRVSAVVPQLESGGEVVLDFDGAKYVTQSFVHALVGEP